MTTDSRNRCGWCGNDPLYRAYHDHEWGVPLRDERGLFELLCLEGQQAGLSWINVLRKREHYRHLFEGFDPERIAALDDHRLDLILQDPGIIRNRLKIHGIRRNAQALLRLRDAGTDFVEYLWSFVDGEVRRNRPGNLQSIPTATAESDAMAKALKRTGFTFVGSTICYAFMQASGMVDDHVANCWRAHGDQREAHANG